MTLGQAGRHPEESLQKEKYMTSVISSSLTLGLCRVGSGKGIVLRVEFALGTSGLGFHLPEHFQGSQDQLSYLQVAGAYSDGGD